MAGLAVPAQAQTGAATQVDLSGQFNRVGIVTDGAHFSNGGFDNDGDAYSANQLGSQVSFAGASIKFGPSNLSNVINANGQTVPLPAATSGNLLVLATGVRGNQPGQSFTVTYSDGSKSVFTQSLSDWSAPQNYPGEMTAATTKYSDSLDGSRNNGTFYVYGYSFPLTPGKTASSLKLPANNNVGVLAVSLTSAPPTGGTGGNLVGDCGMAPSGDPSKGKVDYAMVYKSSQSIVCVDKSYWSNKVNATAISKVFPYFDAVILQDKALFPEKVPNTPFVFEITVPTGGASTGCDFPALSDNGSFCDTVSGGAFTDTFNDPVSHVPVPGFWGYLLSLHESVNVFTGRLSQSWPTDWWADHRSPFPNAMDAEFMKSIGTNNTALDATTKQNLLAASKAQLERFTDKANPTGDYDPEVGMFVNFYNYGGFNGFANTFRHAILEDGLHWDVVSQNKLSNGDSNYSENLSEYVIAYLHLGFGVTSNFTSSFTDAGVGTLDKSIPAYTVNAGNVKAIADAHCSIRAAANAKVDVSAALSALQAGNFRSATANGGTKASCPSECAFTGNRCTAKF